jgi:hypothetical protein
MFQEYKPGHDVIRVLRKRRCIMTIVRGLWKTLRAMSLLVILAVIFTGVLLVSCLARCFYGAGFSDVAGKLRLGT